MNPTIPPRIALPGLLAEAFFGAAAATFRIAPARSISRRKKFGVTLKPGPSTPLWNELSRSLREQLKRRGEQARLGRLLGLPRQRIHELLISPRHLPDAERTLLLLVWLGARQAGRDLPPIALKPMSRNA